jgi:proline racemase
VDLAFGGNNHGIVDASDLHIGTAVASIRANSGLVIQVTKSTNEQTRVQHPEMPQINGVLALLINDEPSTAEATCKNIYVDNSGWFDRSPCGTGTSARMAVRFAKGEQQIGDSFVTESILGSLFHGRLIEETTVGGYKAVVPEITGRAFIIGLNQLVVDNDDPFRDGFVC